MNQVTQPSLLDLPLRPPTFHGELEQSDIPRLTRHLRRFVEYVSDFNEHTLSEVASTLGMSACSASARYRDLKRLGGAYTKRRDENVPGLWHYLVTRLPEGFEA